MTDIKLYEGCWVKTADGDIVGPLSNYGSGQFGVLSGIARFDSDGRGYDPGGDHGMGCYCDTIDVIAVYSSLSEAAAANPEI